MWLAPYVFHVHLKDIQAPGAHDTCKYGQGIVPVEQCEGTRQRLGYAGAISVEHETVDHDPTEEIVSSYRMLRE